MERRAPVVGLDVDVGPALHEHAHDLHRLRPLPDRLVQHRPARVVLGVHVHAGLDSIVVQQCRVIFKVHNNLMR